MPKTKSTTTSNELSATADWFSNLSRNAATVAKAYRTANRKTLDAQKALRKAFAATRDANLLGQKILGEQIASNGSDSPQTVPTVVTDKNANKHFWKTWFAEQQAELDAEAAKKNGEVTTEDFDVVVGFGGY